MQVWRIHLNSDSITSVSPKRFCFDNDIIGVGWRSPSSGPFLTPEEYKASASIIYGKSTSWQTAINTMCYGLKLYDLVWTRDNYGNYYLGEINGEWDYQDSQLNLDADILNIRPCKWRKIGTADVVPGKVATSFFSRRTIQRIHDEPVKEYTKLIFNNWGKVENAQIIKDTVYDESIFSLMTPDDCEDLVGLYLQFVMGYLLIPSTCKSSTLNYEYSLIHRITGRPAIVQVKAGFVDLSFGDYSEIDVDVCLFTTKGRYLGEPRSNIYTIDKSKLLEFLFQSTEILPKKIINRLLLYQQLYNR